MNMSLLEKMITIFKYTFSSFLSIEMFILSLLLFVILIINIQRKNQIVEIAAIGVYLGFIIGIIVGYFPYAKRCLDSFVKSIMNYIYFPSTIVYFFIMVFVTGMMLNTVFSKKISKVKKIINYLFFSILYFFFMSFIVLAAYNGVDLADIVELYKDETILSLIQISNLILVLWILYTLFYRLFLYFKNKYD